MFASAGWRGTTGTLSGWVGDEPAKSASVPAPGAVSSISRLLGKALGIIHNINPTILCLLPLLLTVLAVVASVSLSADFSRAALPTWARESADAPLTQPASPLQHSPAEWVTSSARAEASRASAFLAPGNSPNSISSPCFAWNITQGANVSGGETVLTWASAAAPNDIWAVGFSVSGGVASTLTEHWDGRTWTIVPSPNPQPGSNYLDGVVALSSNNAWAVGDSGTSEHPGTVLLHWDGTTWSQARLPALEPSGNSLYSISAVSPTDIWAAGVVGNVKSASGGLTMHYNGVDWSVVPNPGRGRARILYGISAQASNDAWAVGADAEQTGIQTFVQHWNGTEWLNIQKQPQSGLHTALWSVTAVAPNNVWAVGSYCPRSYDCQGNTNLIEHWNGSQWLRYGEFVPNGGDDNNLASVVAVSENDIWAVGYGKTGSNKRPFIAHWDGTAWAGVPGSSISETSSLGGIAKIPGSGGNLIAVGSVGDEGARRALIEVYSDACAAPSPAPTNTPAPVPATPTFSVAPTYPPTPIPGSNSRTFPETNHTVSGIFLDYWNQNGALPQQGYPISEQFTEISDLNGKPYTVQYFERAVFEYHPENQPPYNVLLSQLGTFQY